MAEAIKVAYGEVEITYFETENIWKFTLCGRDRSAQSLAKAKEFIDKPVPTTEKPFERIKAIYMHYSSPVVGEITSIAESGGYGRRMEVWFVSDRNGRRKENADGMYQHTPENLALIAEADNLDKQAKVLSDKATSTRNSMTKIKWETL